jgi:HEAT repeat protein
MTTVLATLILAASHPNAASFPQEQGLTRKVGDRTVTVPWPTSGPLPQSISTVEVGDWKLAVKPNGELFGPFLAQGEWGDLKELHSRAAAKQTAGTPTWRVRVIVVQRVDVLDHQPIFRRRTAVLEKSDVDHIYESAARFAAAAEAKAEGRLKIEIDLATDEDTWLLERKGDELQPSRAAIESYVRPRINGFAFDTDDKVYRGPFDSVIVVHSGLTHQPLRTWLTETPVTSLPYFAFGEGQGANALASAMTREWESDVVSRYIGRPILQTREDDATGVLSPLSALVGPAAVPPRATRQTPLQISAGSWEAVKAAPLLYLPIVEPSDANVPAVAVFGRSQPTTGIGWYMSSQGPRVVFEGGIARVAAWLNATLQDLPKRDPAGEVLFNGNPEGQQVVGYMTAESVADPTEGPATKIGFRKSVRVGGIELWNNRTSSLDANRRRFLTLRIRPTATEPMSLRVRYEDGDEVSFPLFLGDSQSELIGLKSFGKFADEWQSVTVDITRDRGQRSAAPDGSVESIWLESSRGAMHTGTVLQNLVNVSLGKLTASETGTPSEQFAASTLDSLSPESPSALERAYWCSRVANEADLPKVLPLLKDRSDLVRLNAAAVFTRFVYQPAEAPLTDNTVALDPRVVQMALRALAHQKAESAWASVQKSLQQGPGDLIKSFAAELLAERNDPNLAGPLAVMFTSKSWHARKVAAETLSKISSVQASLIQATFMIDIDPGVRLATIEGANATIDQVCRRILYASVNDGSEAVRAAACIKLIGSPLEQFKAEGYKGVRDESPYVRLAVLEHLKSQPDAGHRQALRIAVVDADPYVRAAALEGFAVLPGEVSAQEIANVFSDPHPEVVKALAALRKAKNVPAP